MKDFLVYTLLRFAVFGATFALVAVIWGAIESDGVPFLPALILSAVISMLISVPLLNRQRVAFATNVEKRANAALEKARQREDEKHESGETND